jgi:hypothetical protein
MKELHEKFRKLFVLYLMKETPDKGPIVITRTSTERDSVVNLAKRQQIPITVQVVSPDMAYVYVKSAQTPGKA